MKLWDVQTGQELLSFQGHTAPASNVAFSPDGKRLASASWEEPVVKVWDAQTGQELLSLKEHTGYVSSVAFSPDGKRLASGSSDNTPGGHVGEIKVWDAETGQELLTFKGGAPFHRVTFSPDGHLLASNAGGTVKIYDATPLAEKAETK